MPEEFGSYFLFRKFLTNLIVFLFTAAFISFWLPDLFYYPFRAFTPGPEGVYGTWTGILRTTAAPNRGTPMTFAAQGSETLDPSEPRPAPSFAAVKLTLRPPLFSTLPNFFWRPSHELVGSLDVYLPDGTHQHCTHRFGDFPKDHQLQLMIYDSGDHLDAVAEAQVTPGKLEFSSGMCPVRHGPAVSFAGTLTPGTSAGMPALQSQLPAVIAADRGQVAAQDANLARLWVGPALTYNPDDKPANPTPNSTLRMQLAQIPNKPGTFTGSGELHQRGGLNASFTLTAVTLKNQNFEGEAKFHDLDDSISIYNGAGSFSGTVLGDTLTITDGGKMLLSVTGTLHPGVAAGSPESTAPTRKHIPSR